LKASKIRGEESNGMLCSSRELQLGDESQRHHRPAGSHQDRHSRRRSARPRRSCDRDQGDAEPRDCLGVHGIARDLAAAGLGTLKPMKTQPTQGNYQSPIKWTHGYEATPDSPCPIVVAVTSAASGTAPRPTGCSAASRPSAAPDLDLVDITNLVTFDLNRPLHVFDARKLSGDLVMRPKRARASRSWRSTARPTRSILRSP